MEVFYTASRASLAMRPAMWRAFRREGVQITASWIDEDGEGETECFTELWDRIKREIAAADRLVLYAEPGDFPLKGALIEVGIALGMGRTALLERLLPGKVGRLRFAHRRHSAEPEPQGRLGRFAASVNYRGRASQSRERLPRPRLDGRPDPLGNLHLREKPDAYQA